MRIHRCFSRGLALVLAFGTIHGGAVAVTAPPTQPAASLPKIRVAKDGRTFVADNGKPFVPFGVNYFRPGSGWAPQVWKQFDAEATRRDFARLREGGMNCVRVFLTYGSFLTTTNMVSEGGLAKLDTFLALAEAAGIYVHPTGPDHWEGTPDWARGDRYADENVLRAQESFWSQLAARYRGRAVLFAYDLLNEPEIRWDTAPMREKWGDWLRRKYGSTEAAAKAWGDTNRFASFKEVPAPPAKEAPGNLRLLDYQRFREEVADEWTRRQAAAIKAVDPGALVTVGLIQWSVPALLPGVQHYSAFRPERQAPFLDFLEFHFYPLAKGFYEYADDEDETRNLAYLENVAREVAKPGKPVVLAEFGWYGGGRLTLDGGRHPPATEEQQARWCRKAVETTAGLAVGWLNWGVHDHPEARDVTQLTGLFQANGQAKAWGREFQKLSASYGMTVIPAAKIGERPPLPWDSCLTSTVAASGYRSAYLNAFKSDKRDP